MVDNLVVKITQAHKDKKILDSTLQNSTAWLQGKFLPEWAIHSITQLVEKQRWEELNDRFYQNLSFGTGGMRSRTIAESPTDAEKGEVGLDNSPEHPAVGSNYLNDFNIIKATIGLYRYCQAYLQQETGYPEPPKLVVAHDVRYFSRHFCELTAATWQQLGGQAYIFDGPRSTPQLSFTVRHIKATAGVVITASHNPSHDNGFKAYFRDGAQMVSPHDRGVVEAYNRVENALIARFLTKSSLSAVITLSPLIDEAYMDALKEVVIDPATLRAHTPKVVFTAIHGTGGIIAIPLLRQFGIDISPVGNQMRMDPRFPTVKSPNPEYPETLSLAVSQAKEENYDVVIGTDPDADRCGIVVFDKGKPLYLSGNMMGSIFADYRLTRMKELGWIPRKGSASVALIKTFVTTPLQDSIAQYHGVKVINTLTGFKWIGEKLHIYENTLKENLAKSEGVTIEYDATSYHKRRELLQRHSTFYVCGGEESYGYLASDRVRDKDANAAALMVCEWLAYLKKQNISLSQYLEALYLRYGYYKEDQLNIYYEGASGAQKIKNILQSYRTNPPQTIDGVPVKRFIDFGKDEIYDADNKRIPPQDFYFVYLQNGYSYAIRGSGTEPKIKFYLFAQESVSDPSMLPPTQKSAEEKLSSLKTAINEDANERAG